MQPTADLSAGTRRYLVFTGIACGVILASGLLIAPARVWSNLLVGTFGLLTIGLGGTVFLALTYVSGAGWHVAFRRVPESMALLVPVTGCGTLVVLALRTREYGWHHDGAGDAGTFWFKELWLTPWFWYLRSIGYVAVWSLLGGWLVKRSRARRVDSAPGELLAANVRRSACFLAVYGVTFSLASVDWIMALEPLWYSTMWGVYNFAGMMLAALAVVVILCILLSAPGRALHDSFNQEHLHDLGKLLVGFSCFWMYIWFSQYMLIWYSNIPEETAYFVTRTHGPWGPVVVAAIVLNWGVPFLLLLPKPAKRSRAVMLRVATVLLLGRWIDLYLMVFPPHVGATPVFGIWEVAAMACAGITGLCLVDRQFKLVNPTPDSDAYLTESLSYHA